MQSHAKRTNICRTYTTRMWCSDPAAGTVLYSSPQFPSLLSHLKQAVSASSCARLFSMHGFLSNVDLATSEGFCASELQTGNSNTHTHNIYIYCIICVMMCHGQNMSKRSMVIHPILGILAHNSLLMDWWPQYEPFPKHLSPSLCIV